MEDKKRNPRRMEFALDAVHFLLGIVIVILAIFAFLSPESHPHFFSVIFFLSGGMSVMNGIIRLKREGRKKKESIRRNLWDCRRIRPSFAFRFQCDDDAMRRKSNC